MWVSLFIQILLYLFLRTSANKEAGIFICFSGIPYWLDCVKHWKMAQTALSQNPSRQFPMNRLKKSVSRNQINVTFMKSFRDFKSKKKSIQILIWKQVYARNFYCFHCFFPFNSSFFYPFTIFVIFYFYIN